VWKRRYQASWLRISLSAGLMTSSHVFCSWQPCIRPTPPEPVLQEASSSKSPCSRTRCQQWRSFVLSRLKRESLPRPVFIVHSSASVPCNHLKSLEYPIPSFSFTTPRGDLTHITNSPNFLPTISSVMKTFSYVFPLWTANLKPRKLGRMVAERAWVLIMGVPALRVMGRRLGPVSGRGC
jgi:hypothetical protein